MSSLNQEQRTKVNNFLRSLNQRITNFIEEMVAEGSGEELSSQHQPQKQVAQLDRLLNDLQQDFQGPPPRDKKRDNYRFSDQHSSGQRPNERRQNNWQPKQRSEQRFDQRPTRPQEQRFSKPAPQPQPVSMNTSPSSAQLAWENRAVSEPHLLPISQDVGLSDRSDFSIDQPMHAAQAPLPAESYVNPVLPQPTYPTPPSTFEQMPSSTTSSSAPVSTTPDMQFANGLLDRVSQKL